jgi:uncharacterized protein (TIGR03435 family)
MTRIVLCLPLLLLACRETRAQDHNDRPQFEVASVKPAPPDPVRGWDAICRGGPGTDDPGLFRCENMSLTNIIVRAYALNYLQVSGPEWLKSQMYVISAKVPRGTTNDQFRGMLQSLLIDRFKFSAHRESKELAQYDLVVARSGPKFKEAVDQPASGTGSKPTAPTDAKPVDDGYPSLAPGQAGIAIRGSRGRVYQPKWTMGVLAGFLSGQIGKPVTDRTGLKGQYEIRMYWSEESTALGRDGSGDTGPTLMRAVQDQLGLRLEAKKGMVDYFVVDHAEKVPTEN